MVVVVIIIIIIMVTIITTVLRSPAINLQMNMVDLEKTDAFLARNIALSYHGAPAEDAQKSSQLHQRIQQLQEEWGLYAVALIRQCVFEHTDASGADGKVYQVSTMKASWGGFVVGGVKSGQVKSGQVKSGLV